MFNWLTNFFSARPKRLRPHAPHIEAVAAHSRYQLSPPIEVNSARVYQQSPWVYVAINRIVEAGALVPLRVFRLEAERRIGIANHPLEQLLSRPNPLTSGFELFEADTGFAGIAWQRLLVPRRRCQRTPARNLGAAPRPSGHRARCDPRGRRLPLRDRWAIHPA